MSVILGKFNFNGKPLNPETIPHLMKHINSWEADDAKVWQNKVVGFGNRVIYNTPESIGEQQPYIDKNSGDVITADVRLDNREELYQKLSVPNDLKATISDTILLLKAYQKWGEDCPKHLIGAFAFAVWDRQKQQLFCTRDQMGCKPFFYSINNEYFAFSSEVKTFTGFDDFSGKISGVHLVQMFSSFIKEKTTFYEDVKVLLPAHSVTVTSSGMKIHKYWTFNPGNSISLSSDEEYVEQFKYLLEEAVQCRMRSAYPIGCQLSGGLDSGSIAAIGNNIANKNEQLFYTYSNEMPLDKRKQQLFFKDESKFINELINYTGIENSRKITTPQKKYTGELKHGLNLQTYPTNVMFSYADRVNSYAQEDGVRTMLSGFLGDEGVTTRCPRYLNHYFASGQWGTLWKELNAQPSNSLKQFLRIGFGHLASKYYTFSSIVNVLKKKPKPFTILHPDFYTPSIEFFLKEKTRKWREPFSKESLIKRVTNHYVEERIQGENLASYPHKIENRYPLTDIRLLEFFIATPLKQKIHNGQTRLLFRKVMEGLIPDSIRLASKWDNHAGVIPYMFIHRMQEFKIIEQLLLECLNDPLFAFIDMELLLFRWRNLNKLFSPDYKGKGLGLSPGKISIGLQMIYLLRRQPEFKKAIVSALRTL